MADDKVGVVPPRPVAINVAELSARITGYELKLREVRADLHRLESLDAPALARLSSELDDLAAARDFIQLYLKNLNADQRAMLGVPQAVDDVVGLVGRTVQRRRAALAADRWQPEVKNDYELLTTALTRLELLWRELADKR